MPNQLPDRFCRLLGGLLLAVALAPALLAQPRTVTILYTSDFHAAVEPVHATWLVDQPLIGGARALGSWIAMMRRENPGAFLFDSGDVFTGQAISTITRGEALVDLFKSYRYDAVCYGNHEFDYGIPSARQYAEREPFPVLAANLFYREDGKPFAKPYAIIEHDGLRIAVIGIFGVDAVPSTLPSTWKTLEARDPLPILRELVPKLRRQADLVVVLAHQGETGPMQTDAEAHPEVQRDFSADKATVAAVPGIDVFIGGHAHRGVEVPWVSPATGSVVVQTYGHGTTLGVLKLTYDPAQRRVVAHSGNLLRVQPGVFPVPAEVEQTVAHWEAKAEQLGAERLGETARPLRREYNSESALGDLVADAMLWKSGAEVALENSGGLRFDLAAGSITRRDIISALPFMNSLATVELTGRQLRRIMEQSLTLKVGMLQVAGIRVRYDLRRPEYQRILSFEVGGKPLEEERTYRVAASSFIATGGDHYETFLEGKSPADSGLLLSDVLAEYLRHQPNVAPAGAPRMVPAE